MKRVLFLLAITFTFYLAQGKPGHNSMSLNPPLDSLVMIRSNLYAVQSDGSTILLDGDMTQYESDFSNNLDSLDIRKMSNFSENLGMIRGTTTLVVERRKTIDYADTIFFKLWQTHQRTYQLEFIIANMEQPGLSGYLEDLYLHTKTPVSLNGTNHVNVIITSDPASANAYRFRLIFSKTSQSILLPVTFGYVKAYQQSTQVNVDWKSEDEINVKKYLVEKSLDGIHFTTVFETSGNNPGVNNYRWIDENPQTGGNYYRVSIVQTDGMVTNSPVLNVVITRGFSFIKVYPNPVKDNNFNVRISNEPAGMYTLRLLNMFGQLMMQKQIMHPGGSSTQPIQAGKNTPKGINQLEIIKPDGVIERFMLLY